MFDNGDTYHHLEFEADIPNTVTDNLLKEFNTEYLNISHTNIYKYLI